MSSSYTYVRTYVVHTHILHVPVTCSSPVIIVVHDGFAVENGQEAEQQSPVPVISHTASIVALSRQVGQRIQGHILVVIQEHLQSNRRCSIHMGGNGSRVEDVRGVRMWGGGGS